MAQVELEGAGERGLDRGDADLAVALRCVAVSSREQGPSCQTGRSSARNQFLVVEIAAMRPRLLTVLSRPQAAGGASPMTSQKGLRGSSMPQSRLVADPLAGGLALKLRE